MFTATTSMKINLTISKYSSHDSRQNITFAKTFRRCEGKNKKSLLCTIKGLVNHGCIDTFWQLLDLSWMNTRHMDGLQVTEIRSINHSEFHNCFEAVHNGLD
jgi:hypothetical protein